MMLRRDRRLRSTGHLEVPKRTVANDGTWPQSAIDSTNSRHSQPNAYCVASRRSNRPQNPQESITAYDPFAARRRLACTGTFDELYRFLKKWEILLVVGRIGAVDLYPFPSACDTTGLKWNDVVPRKLQFRRSGDRQPQSNPVAANASEHLVSDEVSVEAVDRSRADAGQRKK